MQGSLLSRLAREPLVHFALLAAVIFGLHRVIAPEERGEREPIVLSDAFVEGLRERHRRMHGSPPDARTTEDLVRQFVRDEALVREARRLGLDRDDAIVRRRLVQKMELWLEATTEVEEPSDEELRQALAENEERYRSPERIAFEHVFFGRRRADPAADARAAIEAGPAPERGDPFLLGSSQPSQALAQIEDRFGPAFAAALSRAPLSEWSGPIESSYGTHLVRVTERTPASAPELDAVRERVREDVMRARRAEAVRRAIEEIVRRNPVVRE